jgi:transketolase
MINPNAKLAPDLFKKDKVEQRLVRDGFGDGLLEASEENKNVIALCADLGDSTRAQWIAKKFPERYIEVGIGEQNMASLAAGMAAAGKVPFIASYAMFSPGRNWEQIRTAVCYNDSNVKIAGAHSGVSVGPDGATHQAIEDIALTRVLPRMTVVVPCDYHEAKKTTLAFARMKGPAYFRYPREKNPVITTADSPFTIGKAEIFREGKDVSVFACGPLLYNALVAAEELAAEGIDVEVINNHTIKPLDVATIIASVQKTHAVVTVEEHAIAGGMGSAIAEVLAQQFPVPMEFIGVHDRFGETGEPTELIEVFGMGISHIKEAIKKILLRKK